MYEELVKRLREADISHPPVYLFGRAADAIEELQRCLDGVCSDNDALCKRIDELAGICAYHPWPEPPKEE